MCVKWSSEESKPESSTRRTMASLMYNKYEPYNVMQMVDIIYGPLWRDHPIIVSITSIFAIYINLRFVSSKMVDVLCIQLWNMHIEHNEHNCVLDSLWSKTHPWGLGHVCFSAINFNDFHFVVCERTLCCIDMMCASERTLKLTDIENYIHHSVHKMSEQVCVWLPHYLLAIYLNICGQRTGQPTRITLNFHNSKRRIMCVLCSVCNANHSNIWIHIELITDLIAI